MKNTLPCLRVKLHTALVIAFQISLTALAQKPVITSFSPLYGMAGSTVVIQGNNFSSVPDSNSVYFGLARAKVITASVSLLKVIVPVGAYADRISATANGWTAHADRDFFVTSVAPIYISQGSFATEAVVDNATPSAVYGDIDGDGKIDMATVYSKTLQPFVTDLATVSFYLNKGTPGNISFLLAGTYRIPNSGASLRLKDLDGDGKADLIVAPFYSYLSYLLVFKNVSTPGKIVFEPAVTLQFPTTFFNADFYDMDGDGRYDLLNLLGGTLKVFRNISSGGKILFDTSAASTALPYGRSDIAYTNINRDEKTDVIVATNNNYIYIYNTTTINGKISFDPLIVRTTGLAKVSLVTAGDINGDGKPDLVTADRHTNTVSVLKNLSEGGLSFDLPVTFQVSHFPLQILTKDVDGNGSLDIATLGDDPSGTAVDILENKGNNIDIDFQPKVKFLSSSRDFEALFQICNLDNDTRPEILLSNYVLQNQMGSPSRPLVISSFMPDTASHNDTVYITGKGMTGARYVAFGTTPARSFTVISDSRIAAVVDTGSSGYVSVYNSNKSSRPGFVYSKSPSIKIVSSLPSTACSGQTTYFTAIINNNSPDAFWNWYKNGRQVAYRTAFYYTHQLHEGDEVWAVYFSKTQQIKSNVIKASLHAVVTPSIKIYADRIRTCVGRTVTFKANTKNAGSFPSFQWIKNNLLVGVNSAFYTDSLLKEDDSVACILDVPEQCALVPVTSNYIKVQIDAAKPAAPLAIIGPSSVQPGQANLGYSVDEVAEARSYQWQFPADATMTSGYGTRSIRLTWGNASGKITVKAFNLCGGSPAVTKVIALGNSNNVSSVIVSFTMYPNPANNLAIIELNGLLQENYVIQLTDNQGRLLQTQNITPQKGYIKTSISTAGYAPGVYHVIIKSRTDILISKRLLIEK